MKDEIQDSVELPEIDLAALVSSRDVISLERAIAHGTRAMLRRIDPDTCAAVLDQVARFRGELTTPADTVQRALALSAAVRSVLRLQKAVQSLETQAPQCATT